MPKKLIRRQAAAALPGFTPLLSRLYTGRGIVDVSELDYRLANLISPDKLKGIDKAVTLLAHALTDKQRILIVGDYDADGATSSALMVSGLRALGAAHVDYLVPDRFEFGYGLTPEIVTEALTFSPDIIVTVDNGISSIDGVQAALDSDIKVLITDHHLSGALIPAADAIVNPNQPGCDFPSKALAGVGVAFYLLSALRAALREQGWFSGAEPNLADYLDLVSLGTIADVVPMDRNNRILVQEGLRRIRAGRARPGIYALLAVADVDFRYVTSRDLGFLIAPRLNAAGRLAKMSVGIECLLADEDSASVLAETLSELNTERKAIESEMRQQAEQHIGQIKNTLTDELGTGVCLFHPDWHQGVVGIVASRIKDQLHRPVVAFANAANGEMKGSARSIAGFHIRDAFDSIAAKYPGLLVKFGGHAMAAGLSLEPSKFDQFCQAFDAEARHRLSENDLQQVIVSDGELGEEISLSLAKSVISAAPWGNGFAEPVFDGEFEILGQRIVGLRHLKLKLRAVDDVSSVEAIVFNHDRLLEKHQIHLAYRLDINRYRGMESVQLIIESVL